MINKENGYDEFLAKKTAQGREDFACGRCVGLAEAQKQWQQTLEKKALEMAMLDEELENEIYA